MDGFNNQDGLSNQNNGNQNNNNNNNNNHPTNDMLGPNDLDIYLNNSGTTNNGNNHNNANNNMDIWGNIELYNFNQQPSTSYSMERRQENFPQQQQQMQQQMGPPMMGYGPYMGYNQYPYPTHPMPHMMSSPQLQQQQMHSQQMNSGNMQQMGQQPGQHQQMRQQQGPGQNQQMGQQPGHLQQQGHQQMGQQPGQQQHGPGQNQQMGQHSGQFQQMAQTLGQHQHQQPGQQQQMTQQSGQLQQMGQLPGQLSQQGQFQPSQQMGQHSGQSQQTTQGRQPMQPPLQHPPYMVPVHQMTPQQRQQYYIEMQRRQQYGEQQKSRMGSQPLSHQQMRSTPQSSLNQQQQRNQQAIERQEQMSRQETMTNSFNPELYTQRYSMPPMRHNQSGVSNPYQSLHPTMQPMSYTSMSQSQMPQGQRPPGQMPPPHLFSGQFDDLSDAPELPAWDSTTPSTSTFRPQYGIPRSEHAPIRQSMPTLQRALNVETSSNPGSNTQLSGGAPSQPSSRPTTIDLTHTDSPLVNQQQQFQRQQQQQTMNQGGPSSLHSQGGPPSMLNQGGPSSTMNQGSSSMMSQGGATHSMNQGVQPNMMNQGGPSTIMSQGNSSMMNQGGAAHPMNQGDLPSAMNPSGPQSMMNQTGPSSLLMQGGPHSAMGQRGPPAMMGPNGPSNMLNQGGPPGMHSQAGPSNLLSQGRPPSSLLTHAGPTSMINQGGSQSSMSQGDPMSQEMRMRQNGYNPMDYRPLPTSHTQFPYHQPPGPMMMNNAISPTTTASRRAAEQTPKKGRGRGGGRQSKSARAVQAQLAQAQLAQQQQQQQQHQQQMAMQQQHNPYFGLPGPSMTPKDKEEERRRYMMNTIYPKGTKEPDPTIQGQMFPSIEQLHGSMGFPGPSRMMPPSLDSPPERTSQHGGSVPQIHPANELFNNLIPVQDNEPDGDAVYQLLANEANSTAAAAAAAASVPSTISVPAVVSVPQSLAEALNRPPMTLTSGSVPRNDTEAVEMVHQITQSQQPRHDLPDFEPGIIHMPSTSMEAALEGLRLVTNEASGKGARQEPSTSKQSDEPEKNRDRRESRAENTSQTERRNEFDDFFFEPHEDNRAELPRPESPAQPPAVPEPTPQPSQETPPKPLQQPLSYGLESMPDFPPMPVPTSKPPGKPAKPAPRRGKPFHTIVRAVTQASGGNKPKGKGKPRKSREGIDTDMVPIKNAPLSELILPMRAASKKAKINYREDDDEEEERFSPDDDSSGSDNGKKKRTKRTPKKPATGRGRGRKPAKQISPVSVDTPPAAASTSYDSPKPESSRREVEPRKCALFTEQELDEISPVVENDAFVETKKPPARRGRKAKKSAPIIEESESDEDHVQHKHIGLLGIAPKKTMPQMEPEKEKAAQGAEDEEILQVERNVFVKPQLDDYDFLFEDIGPSTSTSGFGMDPSKSTLSIHIEPRSFAPVKKAPDSLDDFRVETPGKKQTSSLFSPFGGQNDTVISEQEPFEEHSYEDIFSNVDGDDIDDDLDKFIPRTPNADGGNSPKEAGIESSEGETTDEDLFEEERKLEQAKKEEQRRKEEELRQEIERKKEQERREVEERLEKARKREQERREEEKRLEVERRREKERKEEERRLEEVRKREEEERQEEIRKEELKRKEKAERKEQKRREKEKRRREQDEREEAERREHQRLEAERKAKEQAEKDQARKEKERAERERIQKAKEKAEKERAQKEKERAEREERARIEKEKKEKREKARLEQERLKELAEKERRERSRSLKGKRKPEPAPEKLSRDKDQLSRKGKEPAKIVNPGAKTIQENAAKANQVKIAPKGTFTMAVDELVEESQAQKDARKKSIKQKKKEELDKRRREMEAAAKKVEEKRERERLKQEEENQKKQEEATKAAKMAKNKKKQSEKAKNKPIVDHSMTAAAAVPIGLGKNFRKEVATSSGPRQKAIQAQRTSVFKKRDEPTKHPVASKLTPPLRKEEISPGRHREAATSRNPDIQRKADVSPSFRRTSGSQVKPVETFRKAEVESHRKQQIPSIHVEHVKDQLSEKSDVPGASQHPAKVILRQEETALAQRKAIESMPSFKKKSAISPALEKTSETPTHEVKKVGEQSRSHHEEKHEMHQPRRESISVEKKSTPLQLAPKVTPPLRPEEIALAQRKAIESLPSFNKKSAISTALGTTPDSRTVEIKKIDEHRSSLHEENHETHQPRRESISMEKQSAPQQLTPKVTPPLRFEEIALAQRKAIESMPSFKKKSAISPALEKTPETPTLEVKKVGEQRRSYHEEKHEMHQPRKESISVEKQSTPLPTPPKVTPPLRLEEIALAQRKAIESMPSFKKKSAISPALGKTPEIPTVEVKKIDEQRRSHQRADRDERPPHLQNELNTNADLPTPSSISPAISREGTSQSLRHEESSFAQRQVIGSMPSFKKKSAISPALGKTPEIPTVEVKKIDEQRHHERYMRPFNNQLPLLPTVDLTTKFSNSTGVSRERIWQQGQFNSNHEPSPVGIRQHKEETPNASRNLFGTPTTTATPKKHSPYEQRLFNQNQEWNRTPIQDAHRTAITPKQRQDEGKPNQPLPVLLPEKPVSATVSHHPPPPPLPPPPPSVDPYKCAQTNPRKAGKSRWDQTSSTQAEPSRVPNPPPTIHKPCILDNIITGMDQTFESSEKSSEKRTSHTEKQEKTQARRESASLEKQWTPNQQSRWDTQPQTKNIAPPTLLQPSSLVKLTDPYIPKNTAPLIFQQPESSVLKNTAPLIFQQPESSVLKNTAPLHFQQPESSVLKNTAPLHFQQSESSVLKNTAPANVPQDAELLVPKNEVSANVIQHTALLTAMKAIEPYRYKGMKIPYYLLRLLMGETSKSESSGEMARRAAQWALEQTKMYGTERSKMQAEADKALVEEERLAALAKQAEERLAALAKQAEDEEARAAALAITSPERPLEEEEEARPVFVIPKRTAPSLISPPFEPLDTSDFGTMDEQPIHDMEKIQEKMVAVREEGEIFTEDEEEEEGEIVEESAIPTKSTIVVEELAATTVITRTAAVEELVVSKTCELLPVPPTDLEKMRSIIDSVIEPLTPEEAVDQTVKCLVDKPTLQLKIPESQPSTSRIPEKCDLLKVACEAIWDDLLDDELFSEEPETVEEEITVEQPPEPMVQRHSIDDLIPEVAHYGEVGTEISSRKDISSSVIALVEDELAPEEHTLEQELATKDIEDLVAEMVESIVTLETQQPVTQPEVVVDEMPLLKEILKELLDNVDEAETALYQAEQTPAQYLDEVEDLFAQQLRQEANDLQHPFWQPDDELDTSFPLPWSPQRPQNEENNVDPSLFGTFEEPNAHSSPRFMASTSFDAFSPSFYGNYGAAFDFGRSPEFGSGPSAIEQRPDNTNHDDVFGEWDTVWDNDVRTLDQEFSSEPNFPSQNNGTDPVSTDWGNSLDISLDIRNTDANLEPEFEDLEALLNEEAASNWNQVQNLQTSAATTTLAEPITVEDNVFPVEAEPTSERISFFEEPAELSSLNDDQLTVPVETAKEVVIEKTDVIQQPVNMEEIEVIVKSLVETIEEESQPVKEVELVVAPTVVDDVLEPEIVVKEVEIIIEEPAPPVEAKVGKEEQLTVVVQGTERKAEKEIEAVLVEVESASVPTMGNKLPSTDAEPICLEETLTDKSNFLVHEEVIIAPAAEENVIEQEEAVQEREDVAMPVVTVEALGKATEADEPVLEVLKRTPEFVPAEFVVEVLPPSAKSVTILPEENEPIAAQEDLLPGEPVKIAENIPEPAVIEEQILTSQPAVILEEEPFAQQSPVKPAELAEDAVFGLDEEDYEETWEEVDGTRTRISPQWSPVPSSMKPLSQEEIEELRRMEKHPRLARRPYEVPEKKPKRTADIEVARKAAARRAGTLTRSRSRSTVDDDEDETVEPVVQKSASESRRAAAEEAETKMLRRSRRRETTSDEEFVPPQPRVLASRRSRRSRLSPQRSVSTDSSVERAPRKTRSQARMDVPESAIPAPVEEIAPVVAVEAVEDLVEILDKAPELVHIEFVPRPVVYVTTSSVISKWSTVECIPSKVVALDLTMPIKKQEEAASENYCLAEVDLDICILESRISHTTEFELVQISQKRKLAYSEQSLEVEKNGEIRGEIEWTMVKSDRAKESYAEGNCNFEEGKPTDVRGEDIFTIAYQDSSKISIKTKETKLRTTSTRAVFKRPDIEGEANWIYPMNKAKEALALATLAVVGRKRLLTDESGEEEVAVEAKRTKLDAAVEDAEHQMKEVLSSTNITTRKRKPFTEEVNEMKKSRVDPATIDPFLEEELEDEDQTTWSLRKSAIFLVEKATAENLENEVKDLLSSLLGKIVLADEQRLKQLIVAIPMPPIWKSLAPKAPSVDEIVAAHPSPCKELAVVEARRLSAVETAMEESTKDIPVPEIAEPCKEVVTEEIPMELVVADETALSAAKRELSPLAIHPIAELSPSRDLVTVPLSSCVKISETSPVAALIVEETVVPEPEPAHIAPTEPAPILTTAKPASIEDRLTPKRIVQETDVAVAAPQINIEDIVIPEAQPVHLEPAKPAALEELAIVEPIPAEHRITPESAGPEAVAKQFEETVIPVAVATEERAAEPAPIDLTIPKPADLQNITNIYTPLKLDIAPPENNFRPVICFPKSFLLKPVVAAQDFLMHGYPENFNPHLLREEDIDFFVDRGLLALPKACALHELAELMTSPVISSLNMHHPMDISPQIALSKKLAIKVNEANPFPGVLYYDTVGDIKRIMYVGGAVNRFKSLLHMKDIFFCHYEFAILVWYEFLRSRGYCDTGASVDYPKKQDELAFIGQIFELYLKKVADGQMNMAIPLKRRLADDVYHAYCAPIEMAAYTKLNELLENFSDLPVGVKLALLIELDEWFDDIFCDENIAEPTYTREEKLALFRIEKDAQGRTTISYRQQFVFTCPLAEWVPQEWKDAALTLYQLRLELHIIMYFIIRRSAYGDQEVRYYNKQGRYPPLSKFSLVADVFGIFEDNDEDEIEEIDENVDDDRQCKFLSGNEEKLIAVDKELELLWARFTEPPFSYAKKAAYIATRTLALYRQRFPNSIPLAIPW